jgi:hypothetical protein
MEDYQGIRMPAHTDHIYEARIRFSKCRIRFNKVLYQFTFLSEYSSNYGGLIAGAKGQSTVLEGPPDAAIALLMQISSCGWVIAKVN